MCNKMAPSDQEVGYTQEALAKAARHRAAASRPDDVVGAQYFDIGGAQSILETLLWDDRLPRELRVKIETAVLLIKVELPVRPS